MAYMFTRMIKLKFKTGIAEEFHTTYNVAIQKYREPCDLELCTTWFIEQVALNPYCNFIQCI